MHRRRLLALTASLVALLAVPRAASADITGFLGFSPSVGTRAAKGVAVSGGFTVVGFEFEYSDISESADKRAPGLRTGMANVFIQTPVELAGFRFYATAGGGFYAEDLGVASERNVAVNAGGGFKRTLAGPLRLRVDYRIFKLSGSPLNDQYHRLYAGVSLSF
jgi:hypothetical protein